MGRVHLPLVTACLRLINTFLTYTLETHDEQLRQLILATLSEMMSRASHHNAILMLLCSAMLRLCRYRFDAENRKKMVKYCIVAMKNFSGEDTVLEYLQFLEELPAGIWVNVADNLC